MARQMRKPETNSGKMWVLEDSVCLRKYLEGNMEVIKNILKKTVRGIKPIKKPIKGRRELRTRGWKGLCEEGGGEIVGTKNKQTKTKKRENEAERTTTETKTYLSQVTEGQKQRVTLEACDRAGSGKTCGKIKKTAPPTSPPPQREGREEEEEEDEKRGWKTE